MIDVRNEHDVVKLRWYNSTSHDVVENVLERKAVGDTTFVKLYSCRSDVPEGSYADATIQDGKKYEYRVYALDDASLKSGFSGSVSITAFVDKTMSPLSNIQAVAKSEEKKVILYWEYAQQGDVYFAVYRSVNGSAYQSHKTVKGRTSLEDFGFKAGDVAKYKVKAINSKGWQSDFSNEVSATFSTN